LNTVCATFFNSYNGALSRASFTRILTSVLNNVKSNTASTRAAAIDLFTAALKPQNPSSISISDDELAELHSLAINEILALPKASKTVSAEHRVALYTMIEFVPPGQKASGVALGSVELLLSKEMSESALAVLCKALVPHLLWVLQHGQKLEKGTMQIIAKEATSSKPATRKALMGLIGHLFMVDLSCDASGAMKEFGLNLVPALETNLKAMSGVSPNSLSGVLEGYVAVVSLLGAVALWDPKKAGKLVRLLIHPTLA
jgi:hypothetical protein